jgi:hypothetical protein
LTYVSRTRAFRFPAAVVFALLSLVALGFAGVGCTSRTLPPRPSSPGRADAAAPGDSGSAGPGGRPTVGVCADRPPDPKAVGNACSCHDECASGFCVDGVCCNSTCTGSCLACNVPGQVGACTPVPDGTFPVVEGQCIVQAAASCGFDGRCDGRGGCRRYPDGSICSPGRCEGGQVLDTKTCTAGICKDGAAVTCAPFACDPASSTCFPTCTRDDQCIGVPCINGSCGKKPLGGVCQAAVDCESGVCADGVCCNIGCTGPCLSCSLPDRRGLCSPAAAGVKDPHGLCRQDDPSTCGESGICNGQGGCSRYPVGSVCQPATCSGATLSPASVCDEAGSCVGGAAISCAPFMCADGLCRGTCQSNDQCLIPAECVQGSCGPKGLGQTCKAGTECSSNFCVDGVCCDSACQGLCSACALPNSPGHCSVVPPGVPDPRAAAGVTDPALACIDEGVATCGKNGRCDGQGGCQRYEDGTVCQGQSCDPDAGQSSVGTCDSGTCQVTTRTCAPYVCNGDRCGMTCDNNTQCSSPNVCQDWSCGKRPDGAACSENRPNECSSGFCAQGVCCATDCKGSCLSCALPRSPGVCTAVPVGGADPTKLCVDQKPASCGTDGKCDGQGGCHRYAVGSVCSPPVCKNGMATKSSFCDAAGVCPPPAGEVCSPIIVCNGGGTACEKTCTKDTQCMAGTKCFGGKCGLLDNGKACDEASDCKSKFCADGVCCNTACGGSNKNDCEACTMKEGATADGVCTLRVGRACNDLNACTKTDICVVGPAAPGASCVGTAPVVCAAKDQCHLVGVCNPANGTCSNPNKPDATACNDGSMCTVGDVCMAGVCRPGPPKACPPADQCRNLCDPATGACNPPKANGTKCDDGNKCTTGQDVCTGGLCTGKAKDCGADACHTPGTCAPATGICSAAVMKPDGTSCNDPDNKCIEGRVCTAGKCSAGTPKRCNEPKDKDCVMCVPATGACMPINEAGKCVDDNKCTQIERCQAGVCVAGGRTMCPFPACQTCQPASGTCLPAVCPGVPPVAP